MYDYPIIFKKATTLNSLCRCHCKVWCLPDLQWFWQLLLLTFLKLFGFLICGSPPIAEISLNDVVGVKRLYGFTFSPLYMEHKSVSFFCKSPLQARHTLCEKGAVLLQFERANFAFMIKFLISNHLVHYVGEWWLFVFIEFFRKSYQMRFNISDVKASLISSLNSHFEGLKVSLC